jgi:hypothetical protein
LGKTITVGRLYFFLGFLKCYFYKVETFWKQKSRKKEKSNQPKFIKNNDFGVFPTNLSS